MKKTLAAALSLLMLPSVLVGCIQTPPPADDDTTEEPSAIAVETIPMDEMTTEEATEASSAEEESTEEETTTQEDGSAPVLYQFAPNKDMILNCYVIKTRHDKYIIIDGGGGTGEESSSGFLTYQLRQLVGKNDIQIEAWFLSHIHDDHVTELILASQNKRAKISVNNIYMNAPSSDFMNRVENGESARFLEGVKSAYDHFIGEGEFDKMGGKNAFTGDVFEIDGVTIEVMMTMSEEETETNINDTSMILKVTIEGQTILFLGDANVKEGQRLLETYGENLKCDFVQMAHHGQNGVTEDVYKAIQPTMCLWPTAVWLFNNEAGIHKTLEVRGWMADMGVKYHLVAGLTPEGHLTFPVDFDSLEEFPIRAK